MDAVDRRLGLLGGGGRRGRGAARRLRVLLRPQAPTRFDARSGDIIWTADVGGIVSGAGSIVGDIYYVSILAGKTYGLDTDTGERVFTFDKGEYNPVISDGERIYLTGYSSINALEQKEKRGRRGAKKGGGKKKARGRKDGGKK